MKGKIFLGNERAVKAFSFPRSTLLIVELDPATVDNDITQTYKA